LERVRQRYRLDERIILYVGTIEPRKNLPKLIEAFAAQRKAGALGHQLVCVGPYGWLSRGIEEQIARANIAHAINFTGYVPFEDLPALYTLAEFFVYPSMYEGFGLPVIEAMACGAPVITGGTGALAEIGGNAILALDRVDADVLGRALVGLAESRDRREALSGAGLQRAAHFSWDRAARESLEIYRETARRHPADAASRSGGDRSLERSALRAVDGPRQVASDRDAATAALDETAGVRPDSGRADVLFGQAYFLRFDPKLWEAQQPY